MRKGSCKRLFSGMLCIVMLFSNTAVTGILAQASENNPTVNELSAMESPNHITESTAEIPTEETNDAEESDGEIGSSSEGEAENSENKGEETGGDSQENPGEVDNSGESDDTKEDGENQEEGSIGEDDGSGDASGEGEAETPDDNSNAGKEDDIEGSAAETPEGEDPGAESVKPEFELMTSADDIASGVIDEDYGHIAWVIDKNGKLTVSGTGDCRDYTKNTSVPWYKYRTSILTAEISVSGMRSAKRMFRGCGNLISIKLNDFNTSTITDMSYMFYGCSSLSNLDVSNFNTSNVTDMSYMFSSCRNLTELDVSNFDTGNVANMSYMFFECRSLVSLDVHNFNTHNVTNMECMFAMANLMSNPRESSLIELNLSGVDTSNVTNMEGMFNGCCKLNYLNVKSFNTSKVTSMRRMFFDCNVLDDLNVENFDTGNVTNMGQMFCCCYALSSLNVSNFNTEKVLYMNSMFESCQNIFSLDVSNFKTENVINISRMFSGCKNLKSLNLDKFNTKNVTDMSFMFDECFNLTSLNLSNFDTSNVTNMECMFAMYSPYDTSSLIDLNVSNFDTRNVTDMRQMFQACDKLTNLDLSNFHTDKVIEMQGMFDGCNNLRSLDLSSFDISNVTNISDIFYNCNNLVTLDISSFDMSHISQDSLKRSWIYLNKSLKTIYTPYNLSIAIDLPEVPAATWYRSDGTTVTELPQNLSYSVALGKNYIPTEKQLPTNQLSEGQGSVFLFLDAMTKKPIKTGRVQIEEEFSLSNAHYYPIPDNGCVVCPLSRNCKKVFLCTYIEGYETLGGWIPDLSKYQSDSGSYLFYLKQAPDKYIPQMPSINTSVETSAPNVETEDGEVALFNMATAFVLDFGKGLKSEVIYDEKDKTIKVAVSTEGKVSYDAIKKEYKASGNKSGKSLDEQFENAEDKMTSGKFGNVDVKTSVKGYLTFAETGEFMEGGAIVKIAGSGTAEYRPVCTAGIGYAKFELGLSVEGKLQFIYVEGNLNAAGQVAVEPYAKIALGAGWSLAHTEIGVVGKLPVEINIPYWSDEESLKIDADVEFYGEVQFFCFGGIRTNKIVQNIWPGQKDTGGGGGTGFRINPGIADDELELLPRNYLSSLNQTGTCSQSMQNESNLTASDSFRYSEISKDPGVYAENDVQYVKLSDGTEVLAWIHDFGDKSSANRTTLVYSVNKNDGKGWSNIKPICSDTSTGDYYPNMTAAGDTAYIVWNKASKVFDDNVSTSELCNHMDVYTAVFKNDAFKEPVMLSEAANGLVEFSPKVAADGNSVAVSWLINSENDYHYTQGKNAIYVCEYRNGVWEKAECYAQNLNYVSDYDMDYNNGSIAVVYAEDADNKSDTLDGTVYYIRNGKKTMIGDASYHAEIVDLCKGKIYFSGGGKVYKVHSNSPSYIYDTGIAADQFTVLKNTAGTETVLFLKQNEFAYDVYASYCRNDIYTSPVPLVSDGSRIKGYSPVYNEDGTISIAYYADNIQKTSDEIYGLTDMVVKRKMSPNVFCVEPDLAYNAYDVAPGNEIVFAATVMNGTDHDVTKVNASLTGSVDGAVRTDVLDVNILPGERKSIKVSYVLPSNIVHQEFTLTITPVDFDDADLSDNSADSGSLSAGASWEFSQEVEPAAFQNVGDIKYYLLSAATDSQQNNYANDSAVIYHEPVMPEKITLDKAELSLSEKTKSVLYAEVLPEDTTFKNVIYTSGDNSIAFVDDNGNVYAVGAGKTVITAFTADGNQSASCEVTVEKSEESIGELNVRELDLNGGEESSLYMKDLNGEILENIIWSTTNDNVVTIDQNGNVAAKGEGIAYLIAETGAHIDVCIVRVTCLDILQLSCEETIMQLAIGETLPLHVTVIPENTTMEKALTYTSDNNAVATVDHDGNVTAKGAGNAVITVSSVNDIQIKIPISVAPPVTYRVTFKTMGGTRVESIEITANRTETETGYDYIGYLTQIPDTYKKGYSFAGWYVNKEGSGETLNINTPITGDMVFYAKWNGGGENNSENEGVLPEDIPADGKIPAGLWIASIPTATYTGKAIKPVPRVYDSNVRLKAGTDYTVAYKNNVKANDALNVTSAPTVIVTGKGNYSGKDTVTFKILPLEFTESNTTVADMTKVYNQKIQKPIPSITVDGRKLKNKVDFTVTYPDTMQDAYQAVGTYRITVTGKGNYTGEQTLTFDITDKTPISKVNVSKIPNQAYTGNPVTPVPVVKYKNIVLTEHADYELEYQDNVNIGKATVVILGKGDYVGKKTVTFQITGGSLKKAKVIGLVSPVVYNGDEIRQDCTLTMKVNGTDITLLRGKDYTVTYQNNIKAGTAKVIYTGVNGYTGTLQKSYKITPYDILSDEDGNIEYTKNIVCAYLKGGSKPEPDVYFMDTLLKKGIDYTLSYKNNNAIGGAKTPLIVVKGKGCFKNKVEIPFSITPQNLSNMTLAPCDKVYKNKANIYRITPKLLDVNGKALSAGKDFDKTSITYTYESDVILENGISKSAGDSVEDTDIIPANTQIRITLICGSGNLYEGVFTDTYRIVAADMKSAKVTIPAQIYTGNAITPDKTQITVKLSGTVLSSDDYDIVSYSNNIKKGKASVTIKGKGNYGGTKTVKFTIKAKGFLWWWRQPQK